MIVARELISGRSYSDYFTALSQSPVLKELHIISCGLDADGADRMAAALRDNRHLEALVFHSCCFDDGAADSLIQGIKNNAWPLTRHLAFFDCSGLTKRQLQPLLDLPYLASVRFAAAVKEQRFKDFVKLLAYRNSFGSGREPCRTQ